MPCCEQAAVRWRLAQNGAVRCGKVSCGTVSSGFWCGLARFAQVWCVFLVRFGGVQSMGMVRFGAVWCGLEVFPNNFLSRNVIYRFFLDPRKQKRSLSHTPHARHTHIYIDYIFPKEPKQPKKKSIAKISPSYPRLTFNASRLFWSRTQTGLSRPARASFT